MDGIYLFNYSGSADAGFALLVFQNGKITGADVGNVLYDGTYAHVSGFSIVVDLILDVPPHGQVVQGVSKPHAWKLPIRGEFPWPLPEGVAVQIPTEVGPVTATFKRLRVL